MPFDAQLAKRIRKVFRGDDTCTEIRMFGGLAFLVNSHMCCGIVKDDLMLRLGKDLAVAALKQPHVRAMDFTRRPMVGMVFVAPPGFARDADLKRWIGEARNFVANLPPKQAVAAFRPKAPCAPGKSL
jgi:TfoX/Sxy family transcriptional regulator of competence genes